MPELKYIGDIDFPVVPGEVGLHVDDGDDVALFVSNTANDHYVKTIDISDETSPTVLDTATFAHDRDEVSGTAIDRTNKVMVVGGRNTMSLMVIDYSDPNNISLYNYETGDEFDKPSIWPEQQVIFVTNTTDDQFKIYDYSDPSSLSVIATPTATSLPQACGFIKDLEIVYVGDQGSNSADTEVVYDVSDPANPSAVWTGNLMAGYSPLDITGDQESGRPYFYVVDGTQLWAFKWDDGNNSLSESSRTSLDQPSGVTYAEVSHHAVIGSDSTAPSMYLFDLDDPANPNQVDTADSGSGDWSDEGGPNMGDVAEATEQFYNSAQRIIYADGNDFVAILETGIEVGPNKPTCNVDATGDEYADLSSSAYSHPNNVAHQDSRWQVRQSTASDWTNPEYDSGWTTEDLEAHTATPIPLDDSLEARVAHRDTNGNLTWSDPVALTTTGTIKEGEGPEGLFFGEENGNRILRFGRSYQDDQTDIKAVMESVHVAPAGAKGEAKFGQLYLTIEYGTDVKVVLTPIIDGKEDTAAKTTHTLTATNRIRDTIEVALTTDVTDSGGNPVAKVALRGTWFGVKIEATDKLGSGERVSIESVELDIEVVRESQDAVNESS